MFGIQFDIASRAHFLTLAAMDAEVGIYGEFLVGYHIAVEVGTDNVAEGPRRQTSPGVNLALAMFCYYLTVFMQLLGRFLYFRVLPFWLVGLHKRQTDIAFRHY